jgi:hypothetical protein
MAVSAGLYDTENWVVTEKDKNRIQAAEMRFLRSTLGITRQDRLTNEAIKKILKVNCLNDNIEVSGICSTHGGEERCLQGFRWEVRREETTGKTYALVGWTLGR